MRRISAICATAVLLLAMAGCGAKKGDGHSHSEASVPHRDEAAQSTFIIQDKPKPIAQLMEGKAGVVTVVLTENGFEPRLVTVKMGDEVRLYLKNKGAKEHNLVIPQFGVVTNNMSPGGDNYIEFTASIKGEWPFFSDAPNASGKAEPGFTGILKVE